MQNHAEEGARIIDRLGFLGDAVPAIKHHHERFDGAGYPDGLRGRTSRSAHASSTSRTHSTRC